MSKVIHKQGGDQLIERVPDSYYHVINWHGFKVLEGSGKGAFFFNEIEERRNKNKSCMILITGAPGEGKSYFALRFGEILDPKFNVNVQVVFDRLTLLHLLGNDSPLKRRQVIMIDEAQFVAGARHWYEEIQKDLMDNIEAVRSRGFVIIIVALHLDLLDRIIRKYVLTYMIYMEERGTGIAYHLYTPRFESEMYKTRLGKIKLSLPDAEKCQSTNCLECEHRIECMTDRAVYERNKKEFLGKQSLAASRKELAHEAQKIPDAELADLIHLHLDEVGLTTHNVLDLTAIEVVIEKYKGIRIGHGRVEHIRSLHKIKYEECPHVENK